MASPHTMKSVRYFTKTVPDLTFFRLVLARNAPRNSACSTLSSSPSDQPHPPPTFCAHYVASLHCQRWLGNLQLLGWSRSHFFPCHCPRRAFHHYLRTYHHVRACWRVCGYFGGTGERVSDGGRAVSLDEYLGGEEVGKGNCKHLENRFR
jgi:hypothetical protein